jgi:hypothetical protein
MKLTVSKQQLVNITQIVGPSDRSSKLWDPQTNGKMGNHNTLLHNKGQINM